MAPSLAPGPSSDVWVREATKQSLRWVDQRLEFFRPIPIGQEAGLRIKAFCELALVYSYLHAWRDPGFSGFDRRLYEFLVASIAALPYAQVLRRQRLPGFAFLIPYLMLRPTGYRSDYYEESIRRLRRNGYLRGTEEVPYRILEREHILWRAGCRREPRWKTLYSATTLAGCRRVLGLDEEAAYSVTHTLFYLTDFGNRDATFDHPETLRVERIVESLLVHSWRTGNWDLVGELLVSLNCLRRPLSPLRRVVEATFREAISGEGGWPSGEPKRTDEAASSEFWAHYHATLVAILYCATLTNWVRGHGAD